MKIDYSIFNYCTKCTLTLVKQTMRCPECGQKVRTRPYYSSKLTRARRVYSSKLLAAKRI
ncbi:hypothetical protein [Candidatus Nitrososphaera sp. FF02]|uniref:hypothetical protein n=1 Tax=Candidatus Nitrososphaera sp. FF02 TaxID=3398226 RepID=UPI0039EC670A